MLNLFIMDTELHVKFGYKKLDGLDSQLSNCLEFTWNNYYWHSIIYC